MTIESRSEYCGKFLLSYYPAQIRDGSIGRGSAITHAVFNTEQEREMFVSYSAQIEHLEQLAADLRSEIRYLKTVPGANQNLRDVCAARKLARGDTA